MKFKQFLFYLEVCSHSRSFIFFIESLNSKDGFYGYKCNSWTHYLSGVCRENPVLMGAFTNHSARGVFYLETNKSPPFAMGSKK